MALPDLFADTRFLSMQPEMLPPQNFGAQPQPAAPPKPALTLNPADATAGPPKPGAGYRFGQRIAQLASGAGGWLGGALRTLPGAGLLAEAAAGEGTPIADTARTAIGATALFNPYARALAAGTLAGEGIAGAVGGMAVDRAVAANDIRGPATKEFQARGGNTTTYATPPMPYVPPQTQSGSIPDTSGYGAVAARPAVAAAAAEPVEAPMRSTAGDLVGGILGLNRIAATQSANLKRKKLEIDALGKIPGARKDNAAAALDELTAIAARAEAARGGTPGSVGGVLGRRNPEGGKVFYPGLDLKNPQAVIVGDKATGRATTIQARPALTEANVQATMKAQKLTREQALSAYGAQGYDTGSIR